MYSFDHWADWFSSKVEELDSNAFVLLQRHDTRSIPECRLNPSFGLNVDTADKTGCIGFWKNGLCDYQVIDVQNEVYLANEAGLEASDSTVPDLFSTFMSFY